MTEYTVTSAAIDRFAEALGEHHPSGVPPTFAIVPVLAAVEQFVRGTDLGLDYRRVVHRSQAFTHHRPLRAGDVVTAAPRLVDARTIKGSAVSRIAVELTGRDGERVCSASTTLVVPAGPPFAGRPAPPSPGAVAVTLTRDDLACYAEASGDHNPIHLDPAAAMANGLPTVIAHGMLLMGIALRVAHRAPENVTACQATFTAPVPVHGVATLGVSGDPQHLDVSHDGHVVAQIHATCHQPLVPNGSTP